MTIDLQTLLGPGEALIDEGNQATASLARFAGASGIAVDSVTAGSLIELPDTTMNGFVVKVSGNDTLYGRGQAFMVLEEGSGDATNQTSAGSVLFRVDAKGGIGTTGGLHVSPGFRKAYGGTQAVWIDPHENMVGLAITNPTVAEAATWDKDFISCTDIRQDPDATVFKVTTTGSVTIAGDFLANVGEATQASLGDVYGFAGMSMGSAADTLIYRSAAAIVGVGNLLDFPEVSDPAAPAANRARLYVKDNGSGTTLLAMRTAAGVVNLYQQGGADVAIADGGTGASTASAALSNLEGAPLHPTFNAQTGTTYTTVLADDGKIVTLSNAAAITLTLPQDSDQAFPVGASVTFIQIGAGQVTVSAGTGATLNSPGPTNKFRAQYSTVTALKRAANTWVIMGDLAAT